MLVVERVTMGIWERMKGEIWGLYVPRRFEGWYLDGVGAWVRMRDLELVFRGLSL